jgi:hypothetical protein
LESFQIWTIHRRSIIMRIKLSHIAPLLAAGAAAVAISAAPIANAEATIVQSPGNAQITAQPGMASQQAGQLQQPFAGDMGGLLFHHGGHGGHR